MLTIDVERVIAARLKVFIEFNDEISRFDQFGSAMSVERRSIENAIAGDGGRRDERESFARCTHVNS